MSNETICQQCVLPDSFPNVVIDEQGICNHCRSEALEDRVQFQERQKEAFHEIIEASRGKSPYEAVACYSGGKDSTYMLKMMVRDWGLKVLAFTLDNGFITEQSKANISTVAELLDVDHMFFKPSRQFMSRMYREAVLGDLHEGRGNYMTRISDVCLSCISVVNAYAARLAVQQGAPMIFAGFTPGQIPRAVVRNPQNHYRETYDSHRNKIEDRLGNHADRYLDVPENKTDLYQMSPFLVYEKSEAAILEQIRELGWEYPEGLDGCTSNCALNVVGNICHEKKFGFHPYVLELSKLVRKGLLPRDEALKKMEQSLSDELVQITFDKVGIRPEELERQTKDAA